MTTIRSVARATQIRVRLSEQTDGCTAKEVSVALGLPLAATAAGAIAGLIVSAIPGLTFSMALILVMPFTFAMEPIPAALRKLPG